MVPNNNLGSKRKGGRIGGKDGDKDKGGEEVKVAASDEEWKRGSRVASFILY